MARRRVGANKGARRPAAVTAQPSKPPAAAAAAEPEALVLTHWCDPGSDGEPYAATVHLSGRRAGVSGIPKPTDSFQRDEEVGLIVPGSGPISISTWVYGLTPGEWSVTADLVRPRADARGRRMAGSTRPEVLPLPTATWSWRRWSVMPGSTTALFKTRWSLVARLARVPAVMPGSLPMLVALGAIKHQDCLKPRMVVQRHRRSRLIFQDRDGGFAFAGLFSVM